MAKKSNKGRKASKADSYANAVAGINAGRAKSQLTGIVDNTLKNQWQMLDILYETDWMVGKIIDLPADAMTSKFIELKDDDLTPEQIKEFSDFVEGINVKEKVNEAIKWADLYGGCAIVMITKDGKDYSEPLDPKDPGELIALNVIDSSYISPSRYNYDPLTSGYGEPTHYRMTSEVSTAEIHKSRIVKFTGVDLPHRAKMRHNWWGASRITRLQDLIKTTQMTIGATGELIFESKFDAIKIPGLSNLLMGKNADKLISIYENINIQKSVTNSILIDSEMEIESHTYQFAGIRDIIQEMMVTLAGAASIPESILIGRNIGGLNSSNKEVYKEWAKSIGERQMKIRPQVQQILDVLLFQVKLADVEFDFVPLFAEDEGEKETRINTRANTDIIYINAGVVTPDEVREQVRQDGVYDNMEKGEVEIDFNDPEGEEGKDAPAGTQPDDGASGEVVE